jgi:HSP20 family protein
MKMAKWDPFRELEVMSARLNGLFGRAYPLKAGLPEEALTVADWAPVVDIKETPEEFVVKAELPEVNKEDVKVAIEDGVLSIRGERKLEKEEKGKRYHRIERAYGTFMRSFTLPEGIEEKKLLASYKDGVLEIHLPKAPVAKPKAIEVKVA